MTTRGPDIRDRSLKRLQAHFTTEGVRPQQGGHRRHEEV